MIAIVTFFVAPISLEGGSAIYLRTRDAPPTFCKNHAMQGNTERVLRHLPHAMPPRQSPRASSVARPRTVTHHDSRTKKEKGGARLLEGMMVFIGGDEASSGR